MAARRFSLPHSESKSAIGPIGDLSASIGFGDLLLAFAPALEFNAWLALVRDLCQGYHAPYGWIRATLDSVR